VSEPTLTELADKVDDVARLLTRQASTLATLCDTAGSTAGPDLPLLVELHALRNDALTCAATARSRRERAAFEAIAAGMARLLIGRGGQLVEAAAGDAFSGTWMEVAQIVAAQDPAQDRTVAGLMEPGLAVGGRSVRPARVAVFRIGRG
jgi:molecular chaperone GrpE